MLKRTIEGLFVGGFIAALPLFLVAPANAQITNEIKADIPHSFTIVNTTLPAGRYDFRMVRNSDLQVMTVQSQNGDVAAEFLVRQSDDNHTPKHTELVFNRYGNREFLEKVYESGNKIGVAVNEPSRDEQMMESQGQHAMEHTETEQGW